MARCIGKSFRFPAALQQGVTVSPFHGKNVIDTTFCVDLTGENVTFASSQCPVATADHVQPQHDEISSYHTAKMICKKNFGLGTFPAATNGLCFLLSLALGGSDSAASVGPPRTEAARPEVREALEPLSAHVGP